MRPENGKKPDFLRGGTLDEGNRIPPKKKAGILRKNALYYIE